MYTFCAYVLFRFLSWDHKVNVFKFIFQDIKEVEHLSSTLCIFTNFFITFCTGC